jgi:acylphosphatase
LLKQKLPDHIKDNNLKHLNIRVCGRVQMVLFRDFTQRKAKKLGVCGFVRNEKDGSVYIEVEGYDEAVDKFLEWCKQGSKFARVDSIKIENISPRGFKDFKIEYS